MPGMIMNNSDAGVNGSSTLSKERIFGRLLNKKSRKDLRQSSVSEEKNMPDFDLKGITSTNSVAITVSRDNAYGCDTIRITSPDRVAKGTPRPKHDTVKIQEKIERKAPEKRRFSLTSSKKEKEKREAEKEAEEAAAAAASVKRTPYVPQHAGTDFGSMAMPMSYQESSMFIPHRNSETAVTKASMEFMQNLALNAATSRRSSVAVSEDSDTDQTRSRRGSSSVFNGPQQQQQQRPVVHVVDFDREEMQMGNTTTITAGNINSININNGKRMSISSASALPPPLETDEEAIADDAPMSYSRRPSRVYSTHTRTGSTDHMDMVHRPSLVHSTPIRLQPDRVSVYVASPSSRLPYRQQKKPQQHHEEEQLKGHHVRSYSVADVKGAFGRRRPTSTSSSLSTASGTSAASAASAISTTSASTASSTSTAPNVANSGSRRPYRNSLLSMTVPEHTTDCALDQDDSTQTSDSCSPTTSRKTSISSASSSSYGGNRLTKQRTVCLGEIPNYARPGDFDNANQHRRPSVTDQISKKVSSYIKPPRQYDSENMQSYFTEAHKVTSRSSATFRQYA